MSDGWCDGIIVELLYLKNAYCFTQRVGISIDGYGSKSTNSDLAGFYLLLYIRQHAGLFRRRTNVNDVFDSGYFLGFHLYASSSVNFLNCILSLAMIKNSPTSIAPKEI
jgi:hypothetical protein